jgi:hypothetical protein
MLRNDTQSPPKPELLIKTGLNIETMGIERMGLCGDDNVLPGLNFPKNGRVIKKC